MPDTPARDWVTVTSEDVARLLPAEREHVAKRPDGDQYYGDLLNVIRHDGCTACPFLAGTIGRVVRCTIYDRRPDGCRAFEPGSTECREYRLREGIQ